MEAQARPSGARDLMLLGFVILFIGISALLSQLAPAIDRYLPLVIGLVLLAVFIVSRAYIALIFGGILTGIGGGLLVAHLFAVTGDVEGGVTVLGLGLGFVSIWALSMLTGLHERHWWPLIPGGILSVVGISLIADAVADPLAAPIVLVGAGIVLITIAFVRMRLSQATG